MLPDQVHMLISIPPKYGSVGELGQESAGMLFQRRNAG